MQNVRLTNEPRNPVDALDERQRRIVEGVSALLGEVFAYANERARAAQPAPVTVEQDPPGLMSKPRAAKAIGKSTATLDRLCAEGAPVHFVGAAKMFDLAELRAWLDARGRRPTHAKASDRVDISDIAAHHGLRAIGP